MLNLETPAEFASHIGECLGVTPWVEITQGKIDAFAELTGDDHWIHIDQERSAREQPGGRTIAHGLFLLALIPRLQRRLFRIKRRGAGLSYGYDKVRFTAAVPSGAFVRLRQDVMSADPHGLGMRIGLKSTFEMQEAERPALVAHGILVISDAVDAH